jgi:hypothetical protein
MELYQRVSLVRDHEDSGLKAGDVATLVDYVDHPEKGEKGCVLEINNALGDTLGVVTVPFSSIESLRSNEIFSVRPFSRVG